MEPPLLFKDWPELARAAVAVIIAYGGFIVLLRLSGKRTLGKMNVFDFVFVVALGSTLATTILSSEITVTKGLVACATLILIQVGLSKATTRSKKLENLINGEPTLLYHHGEFLHETMRHERVTEEEIRAAARAQNLASLEIVENVVLETDGTLTVIWRNIEGSKSALADIADQERQAAGVRRERRHHTQ
jgi:uncharacterized membrane protein YcaP (DUF421 family)